MKSLTLVIASFCATLVATQNASAAPELQATCTGLSPNGKKVGLQVWYHPPDHYFATGRIDNSEFDLQNLSSMSKVRGLTTYQNQRYIVTIDELVAKTSDARPSKIIYNSDFRGYYRIGVPLRCCVRNSETIPLKKCGVDETTLE